MSEEILNNWKKAKRDLIEAAEWQALPEGPKYQCDSMEISLAHCEPPKLCRTGQQYHAGKNYWYTEKQFNKAILEHIVENWTEIYPYVLAILKKKESEALKKCQGFVSEMQAAINKEIAND